MEQSPLSYLPYRNQPPKKCVKPIFATQNFTSSESNGTYLIVMKCRDPFYMKRSNNSSASIVQNLTPAFFAHSENKPRGTTPRQPIPVNTTAIQRPSFSSCVKEKPVEVQVGHDSRCITVHSMLNSPPTNFQKEKERPIVYSLQKSKPVETNGQSQYSRTTKDSTFIEEQIGQLRFEVQMLNQRHEEFQVLSERLKLAESLLQKNVEKTNEHQTYIMNIQKNMTDIEIKTDQTGFTLRDLRQEFREKIDTVQQSYDAILQNNKLQVEKELEQMKLQFAAFTLRASQLNTTSTPNSIRPQEVDAEHLKDYINKYEQFNRDVTNYMANRQQKYYDENDHHGLLASLNQSDVETIENYDLSDSIINRKTRSPPRDSSKDTRFLKTQSSSNSSDCKQFDLYDLTKHSQIVTQSVVDIDQKIKTFYKCQLSAIQEHQMEESCVVQQLYLDEQGYFINEKSEYVLDANGQRLKLTENQIADLRSKDQLQKLR